MYISEEAIRLAFKGMSKLDVSSVGGKSRQERASAISYLISVSHILKLRGQRKLDLGVDNVDNRQALKDAVEDFLKIPGSDGYTVDFYTKFSEGTGVSSNFLTTVVAGTRGRTTTKEYPGRPAPLLSIFQEKVEILSNVKTTLENVYGLSAFKVPLVLWILKDADFVAGVALDAATLNLHLADKFEGKISSALSVKDEELDKFCQDILHGPLILADDMPNVGDLYEPQMHVNPNSLQGEVTVFSLELEFRKWLAEREYSERSINSYAGTSIKFADDLLKSAGALNQEGLYCVTSNDVANKLLQDLEALPEWLSKNETGNDMYRTGVKKYIEFLSDRSVATSLPKPFLLLAGISGTGKSRFVRKQAEGDAGCYELVPVRPDWHEPSDLLGYVSRINGERYVVTPFLKFLVNAWRDAFSTYTDGKLALNSGMKTFWLCLDEMNLAPVEQYFADYLSVLETRSWEGDTYSTEALVKPSAFEEEARRTLREGLGLEENNPLWLFFMEKGIQLAPNLVVAGTVNMDETTHGFSRKVIDRAYTIDFGEFFPNHFDQFFTQQTRPKKLSYSCYSSVDQSETLSLADPDGGRSIQFLYDVNEVFKDTAFQLAFRALNELLVTIKCFSPADDTHLKAVWDDFLMAKLLPRVEGDLQKIGQGEDSLLRKLGKVLATKGFDGNRPDLLSESVSGGAVETGFRSTRKIDWMQKRLDENGFTSFWP